MQTPSSLYENLVAKGALHHDSIQYEALKTLDSLHENITLYLKPRPFLRYFKAPSPPKGLYFYGGVGRGKSMLMDMFFKTVKSEQKRRIHFHNFMTEVHDALHEARKPL